MMIEHVDAIVDMRRFLTMEHGSTPNKCREVLENLAKNGLPSRAEITDAAMGERAECVMLNKGPYIVDAVRVLDDILQRMENHQSKKRSMLRHLRLADRLWCGNSAC